MHKIQNTSSISHQPIGLIVKTIVKMSNKSSPQSLQKRVCWNFAVALLAKPCNYICTRFVWLLSFDLSGMDGPTRSICSSHHSSPGYWSTQANLPRPRLVKRGQSNLISAVWYHLILKLLVCLFHYSLIHLLILSFLLYFSLQNIYSIENRFKVIFWDTLYEFELGWCRALDSFWISNSSNILFKMCFNLNPKISYLLTNLVL